MGGNLARPDERQGRRPALTADGRSRRSPPLAAERFGDRVAVVDGDVAAHLRRAARRRRGSSAPRSSASGVEPGDRVAIWAPNSAQWIVVRARLVAGRRRARADQHALQGRGGGRHPATQPRPCARSPSTDFLGTDYVAMLDGLRPARPRRRTVLIDGPDWDDVRWRAARRTPTTGVSRRSTPTTRPTSSSRRAPPAFRRASCRRTAARCSWPPTGWR